MGSSFGGVVVQFRDEVRVPITRDDPAWKPMEESADAAHPLLAALYEGRVSRTDVTVPVQQAWLDAERPCVAFHGRCVVLFDRYAAMGCDYEHHKGFNPRDQRLVDFSLRAGVERVMAFSLDGETESYGFAIFQKGSRIRRWSFIASHGVDEGVPLATEPRAIVHPEERIGFASRALLGDMDIVTLAEAFDGPVFECQRS